MRQKGTRTSVLAGGRSTSWLPSPQGILKDLTPPAQILASRYLGLRSETVLINFFAESMIAAPVPLEEGSRQKSELIEDCARFPF